MPAPPLAAIDEPAPDTLSWLDESGERVAASTYICLSDDSKTTKDDECNPSPEENEQLRRQEEEFERAITPASGSEPRAIARLRLEQRGPRSHMDLIAWKGQSGHLCLADEETDEEDGGGGGPFGPCVPGEHCDDICLTYSGGLVGTEWLNTVAGVFPARADLLRITYDDGPAVSYKLNGPLVPGFPDYRVFMLDLGRNIETRLELFQGDKLIAEEKRSRPEIVMARCSRDYPVDVMPRSLEEAEMSPLAQCFEKATSK